MNRIWGSIGGWVMNERYPPIVKITLPHLIEPMVPATHRILYHAQGYFVPTVFVVAGLHQPWKFMSDGGKSGRLLRQAGRTQITSVFVGSDEEHAVEDQTFSTATDCGADLGSQPEKQCRVD
jgi:hypothetical protein